MKSRTMDELKSMKSDNCDLISLYVTLNYPTWSIISQLSQERKYIEESFSLPVEHRHRSVMVIHRVISALYEYLACMPKTGIVVFASQTGATVFVPREPVKVKVYICERKFFTMPLEELFEIADKKHKTHLSKKRV